MLSRRQFLARGTTVLLLVPIGASCMSGSSSSSGPNHNPQDQSCDGVDSTSSVVDYHEHTVCVPSSDLSQPPAGGATYTTSDNSQHTHTVTLSQAQLQQIDQGGDVTVTSSSSVDPVNGAAHTHDFSIRMA